MTGFDSKRQMAQDRLDDDDIQVYAQPAQEPVAWTTMPDAADWDFVSGSKDPNGKLDGKWVPLYTTPQPTEPRNFCSRCGKRTADLTVIHTCTPPRGLENT